jgi:hypothetical protein
MEEKTLGLGESFEFTRALALMANMSTVHNLLPNQI